MNRFTLACAAATVALMSTPAFAEEPLTRFEGEWTGLMQVGGMLGTLDVNLTATEVGGLLEFKRHFVSCDYVFAPRENDTSGVFERFLTSKTGTECAQGDIRLSVKGMDTLSLDLIGFDLPPIALKKVSGPLPTATDTTGIDILGFTLNDPSEKLAEVTKAPVAAISARRSQTSGMRGDLSRYADIMVTQAEWRVSDDGSDVANDIVGAYSFDGDATASAITRVWLPEPQDAPTLDATMAALRTQYGPETVQDSNGSLRYRLTWHFDTDGQRIAQGAKHACTSPLQTQNTILLLRYVGSEVRLVPGNDAMIMGVPVGVRRSAKKEMQNFQVEPRIGCGATLSYHLSARENGGLRELTALAYEHAPFLSGKWSARKAEIMREVERIAATSRAQQGNAPRL